MSLLHKVIYIINAIPIKIPIAFFKKEIEQAIVKFIRNLKELQITEITLEKDKVGGPTLLGFKNLL